MFAAITVVALVITTVYVARDPFTRDWRDLQSSTPGIDAATNIYTKLRQKLPSTGELTGQAYQLVFAVDEREDVAPLVKLPAHVDEDRPGDQKWMRDVFSMDDLLPAQQKDKLAVLSEIRPLLDTPELLEELSPADRAKLAKLRPPDDLRLVTDADVPHRARLAVRRARGSRGRLVVLRGATAPRFVQRRSPPVRARTHGLGCPGTRSPPANRWSSPTSSRRWSTTRRR